MSIRDSGPQRIAEHALSQQTGEKAGVFMHQVLSTLVEGCSPHECTSTPSLQTNHVPKAIGTPKAESHVLGVRSLDV